MNVRVSGYISKAERFLVSARLLHRDGDYDSAASRLYYSMFHCAEALLLTKDLEFSSHRGVIAAFGQHFSKTGEFPPEMHRSLQEGFSLRHTGDYVPMLSVNEQAAAELLVKASDFLNRTKAYLGGRVVER